MEFKVGQRVEHKSLLPHMHASFGLGTITEIDNEGIKISFDNEEVGTKIIATFAASDVLFPAE